MIHSPPGSFVPAPVALRTLPAEGPSAPLRVATWALAAAATAGLHLALYLALTAREGPEPPLRPPESPAAVMVNLAPVPTAARSEIDNQAEGPPATATQEASGPAKLNIVRAMIAAAKADGHLDDEELRRTREAIAAHELDNDAKTFLLDALSAPSDAGSIAKLAQNQQQACEIYIGSRLVIGDDTPEEHRYMDKLAAALKLPGTLTKP